ncbi:MAG TPA: SDR family oxidoreductase [Candidatus Eisenbacteria bacterium]|jgi:enoyl-[acyl-carrier protein] reductase III|nr:SDR family oxidoreductase [Candidatus Eisenbacteria bacterium]
MENSPRFLFISGGTRGIGRAITLSQARPGLTVFLNYLRDEESAASTRDEAVKKGAAVHLLPANVGDPEAVLGLFESIRKTTDRLDAVIHNAALGVFKPVSQLRVKDWDLSLDVNAKALLLLTQGARPLMKKGGSIVTISSLGSHRYTPNYGAIGISKAALENLVRYLAVELGPEGIRVNAVSGGLVETDSVRHFPQFEAMKKEFLARTPGGRIGSPEDIAKVVDFLLGPASGWVYGQTIVADGGYSLS